MCFSAPASFVASGILTVIGGATIKKKILHSEKMFAIIPFLFAFQQLIEGFQWMLIKSAEPSQALGYVYLFFAFLLWPTYLPISIYMMEKNKKHIRILRLFIVAGFITTVYLLFILLTQPLEISVVNRSIQYLIAIPLSEIRIFIYAAIICGSCFASSDRHIRRFGWAILSSFFIAFLFFHITLISTWCFFVAILSLMVYFHFVKKSLPTVNRENKI